MIVTPLPILAYADIHYRFKYFFSYLKKREPEILADIPHRIEPNSSLPILLLVKDAHWYPIELTKVSVHCFAKGKKIASFENVLSELTAINKKMWWKIAHIPFTDSLKDIFGFIDVDVHFTYKVNGKEKQCTNDNYRTTSKKSFLVFRAQECLPSFEGWIQGDAHTHSDYTDDHVEFGAPMEAGVELCKAIGISFFCVTDHSYDLDDHVDNFLLNDAELPKWNTFQNDVDAINAKEKLFAVIRGEEVSCWNGNKRNIHLLLFGTRKFFHGSGDSAEKWFQTKAEYTIEEVLAQKDPSTVAFAAHPTETAPFFQSLLIKRGEWSLHDMANDGLNGIQILNGVANQAFIRGLAAWKKFLLQGRKIFIIAGNDAHGNFNRFRQVKIPFFYISEWDGQLFGQMRTALRCEHADEENILTAFRNGNAIITNGPLAVIEISNENTTAHIGETIFGTEFTLSIKGVSTIEFGTFTHAKLFQGTIGQAEEILLSEFSLENKLNFYQSMHITNSETQSYIRLEACTEGGTGHFANGFCFTNPIWLNNKKLHV